MVGEVRSIAGSEWCALCGWASRRVWGQLLGAPCRACEELAPLFLHLSCSRVACQWLALTPEDPRPTIQRMLNRDSLSSWILQCFVDAPVLTMSSQPRASLMIEGAL